MTYLLQNIKPNDTVEFRCGGRATVEKVEPWGRRTRIFFEGFRKPYEFFTRTGKVEADWPTPFDVVELRGAK